MKSKITHLLFAVSIVLFSSCSGDDDNDSLTETPYVSIEIASSDGMTSYTTDLYKTNNKLHKAVFNKDATGYEHREFTFTYDGAHVATATLKEGTDDANTFNFIYDGDVLTGYTVNGGVVRELTYDAVLMEYTAAIYSNTTTRFKLAADGEVTQYVATLTSDPDTVYTQVYNRETTAKGVLAPLDQTNVNLILQMLSLDAYYITFTSRKAINSTLYMRTGIDNQTQEYTNIYGANSFVSSVTIPFSDGTEGAIATFTYLE